MAVHSVSRKYYKKFAFTVEIPGFGWAGFKACSALKVDIASIDHYEGGALAPHQGPGRVKTNDVTLSRGATDDLDMWNWIKLVIDAAAMADEPNHEKPVTIVQRDRGLREKRRWVLTHCWPTSWTAGEWDNDADQNTIEELVLKVRYPSLGGENPV